ncbi:uncharacterized protein LOC121725230 [Aricia agestis]|uniref:uncharacterized protein LOC121725230 n=1 Tax=Aricia agestis TaxID=91739 RepID=UPI001C206ADC|nr:uncharacterized protein LOC121725230 [Aricia agestis]
MAGNIVVIIAALGVAVAQDYFDDRYKYKIDTAHSIDIPKNFEAIGPDALKTISKYVSDIQKTAELTNSLAKFDVQVSMEKKRKSKHGYLKPTKSKKFKVPLKKKNLRLSSFEIDLRKYASENIEKKMAELEKAYSNATTEKKVILQVTKKNKVGKFRPYLTAVKPKYHKNVKPVPNKEIVLN